MRSRLLLASTGLVLLTHVACTSDLPAPTNYIEQEPPAPPNELELDCAALDRTAVGATVDFEVVATGQIEGAAYEFTAPDLPMGLTINAGSGVIGGSVEAEPGSYTFDVVISDIDDPEMYTASTSCTVDVRPRLNAPITVAAAPCLQGNDASLLDLIDTSTGDGTPITCDFAAGEGDGRLPAGITIDEENCRLQGSITDTRYGTWVLAMRGSQSGAAVYVPYCVTNDVQDGYEIRGGHSGETDNTLEPMLVRYDPNEAVTVGPALDPRFEAISPGACGAACYFQYSFSRTVSPIANFTLEPDGLVNNEMMQPVGFFHTFSTDVPVNSEFARRPWVMSVAVRSCLTGTQGGCGDIEAEGDGYFEFGLVMLPDAAG